MLLYTVAGSTIILWYGAVPNQSGLINLAHKVIPMYEERTFVLTVKPSNRIWQQKIAMRMLRTVSLSVPKTGPMSWLASTLSWTLKSMGVPCTGLDTPCKVNRVMEADTTLGVGGSRICVYAVFEVIRRI